MSATLLFKNDLPADFDLWQKIAAGLVSCSKELDVGSPYLERFECLKKELDAMEANVGDKDVAPEIYADAVIKADAAIIAWSRSQDLPENVKELFKRYNASIKSRRPSDQIDSIESRLEWLKDDLDKDEDALDDVQSDIRATRSELRDIEKEIDKLRNMYAALFDEERD